MAPPTANDRAADTTPAASRAAASLVSRFGIVAFLVSLLIALFLGASMRQTISNRAISDATRAGSFAAETAVLPALTAADFDQQANPLSAFRVGELDARLGSTIELGIWNGERQLVYSRNETQTDQNASETNRLDSALSGTTDSERSGLDGNVVAVYGPIRQVGPDPSGPLTVDRGEIVGAYQIYLPYQPIADGISADVNRLWILLGLGLLGLFLALLQLTIRTTNIANRQAAESLQLATQDELTGLANRERFLSHLHELLESADPASPIALLLLDIDGFQAINDTLGHDRGDEVLRRIGRRLSKRVRNQDLVARLGGDEFAVAVTGVDDDHQLDGVVERFLDTLTEPIGIDGINLDVHCSAGVSRFPDDAGTAGTMLRHADVALYAAKRNRSRVEIYEPALDHYSAQTLELVSQVREGISTNQFSLAYQAKLDIKSNDVIGFEALLRWDHPSRGPVEPSLFMPAVEMLPICRELTDHVLGLAIEQLAQWHSLGFTFDVAVNLSARDSSDPRLPEVIKSLLQLHGVESQHLQLELTESTALANPEMTRKVLGEIADLGCTVSVDDFGTGFASLGYIASLPVAGLKIDQSYVTAIESDDKSAAIVRHSIQLGHALGLFVVAEGVESPAVLNLLAAMNCDIAQGFGIAEPMRAEEVTAWFEARRAPQP